MTVNSHDKSRSVILNPRQVKRTRLTLSHQKVQANICRGFRSTAQSSHTSEYVKVFNIDFGSQLCRWSFSALWSGETNHHLFRRCVELQHPLNNVTPVFFPHTLTVNTPCLVP